jgi:hypothetical protein
MLATTERIAMATTAITTVMVNRMQARAEPHLSRTVPLWRQRKHFYSHRSLFHFQIALLLLLRWRR